MDWDSAREGNMVRLTYIEEYVIIQLIFYIDIDNESTRLTAVCVDGRLIL